MNERMRRRTVIFVGILTIALLGSRLGGAQEKPPPGTGFAAIPGLKGGQDIYGPYEVVENWPKPMSESLPGHEGWTYSVTMDVFAESPDRVFLVQKGELPIMERPSESVWLPELGLIDFYHLPNIFFVLFHFHN